MANQIYNIATQLMEIAGEPFPLIAIELNVSELSSLDSLMNEVVDSFKIQRMIRPPETAGMLVTLIGDLTTLSFKENGIPLCNRILS